MNRKDRRATQKSDPASVVNALFAQAVDHHQAGRLAQAVTLYKRILTLLPVAEVNHNLGVALNALGKHEEALAAFAKAIALKPDFADAHNSLGNALADQGRYEEAIVTLQKAVSLSPHKAFGPNNLGTALLAMGRLEEACQSFRQAINLDASYAEAHNNLGATLVEMGQWEEGLASYDRALALDANHPRAHANRASVLFKMNRLTESLVAAHKAVVLAPQSGLSLNTLANTLKALGHLTEAADYYAQAVKLMPQSPELHDNLGNTLSELGRSVEAEACCRQALTLDPNFAKAHNNLGTALKDQGKREEAHGCFVKALNLAPSMAAAHTNLGMSLLYQGHFKEGWKEFEWRWNTGKLDIPSFPQPRWVGTDLRGKTILLLAEQGMGDVLQFVRYVDAFAALGAQVILQVHQPLCSILATLPGVSQVVPLGQTPPAFDTYLPLMSAPLVMGTTLETIPSRLPYLHSDPEVRIDLPPLSGFKVGLVWAGDPRPHDPGAHAADRRRSIPLTLLTPLLQCSGVSWVSLQKGAACKQLEHLTPDLRPVNVMDEVTDFAQTARLIDALDLVISVDTSVVHLAGAMAKPVWMLSRYDGCWRWLADREDSPWYPSLRIFRQIQPGDWPNVIERVKDALTSHLMP